MGVSSNVNSSVNWINNIVSVPLSPVQKVLSFVSEKVEGALTFFSDIKTIKEENKRLKEEIIQLQKENRELSILKYKNEELKAALMLKDHFDDYQLIGANVIAKDPGNWFDVFKIDVGQNDGVFNDSPVITSGKVLIGRVAAADATSSKVVSIIDENSVISAMISKPGGDHVIVRGDYNLKGKGLCRMDHIPYDANIEVGDMIETSGLGGIYPKGILIGTVKQIIELDSNTDRYAVVEPAVNLRRIDEVFVLKSVN